VEAQFEAARITRDKEKYNAVISNLGWQQLDLVNDVIDNPPPTGLYENLKAELIRSLTDSDGMRVQRPLEAQDLGDRTPSQLYRDMRKLATPAVLDDFLLTMWKNRLPASMRAILAPSKIRNPNELMEMADRIHEVRLEVNATSTSHIQHSIPVPTQQTNQHHGTEKIEAQMDRIERVLQQLAAVNIGYRRRSRSTSRFQGPRTRSNFGNREQHPDWCYYHQTYRARARKYRAPCTWNQGNPSSRP
jgi:hypothetical protein